MGRNGECTDPRHHRRRRSARSGHVRCKRRYCWGRRDRRRLLKFAQAPRRQRSQGRGGCASLSEMRSFGVRRCNQRRSERNEPSTTDDRVQEVDEECWRYAGPSTAPERLEDAKTDVSSRSEGRGEWSLYGQQARVIGCGDDVPAWSRAGVVRRAVYRSNANAKEEAQTGRSWGDATAWSNWKCNVTIIKCPAQQRGSEICGLRDRPSHAGPTRNRP